MTSSAKTVMIVDDDAYARMALESLLARDARTRIYDAVSDLDVAYEVLSETDVLPDLILLDVHFDTDFEAGLRYIEKFREASSASSILVMSVSQDPGVAREAIKRGGDGFVSKADSAEAIANAVVMVSEGRSVISESVAQEILEQISEVNRYILEQRPTERRLLELTKNIRRTVYLYCICGLSAKEIAEEQCVSINTVNTRLRDAFRVLGASGRSEAFKELTCGGEQGGGDA